MSDGRKEGGREGGRELWNAKCEKIQAKMSLKYRA